MHLHELDLNLMMSLHLLLQERSVTRAAQRLGRTQSALSHALGRLRELFDDPLLVRAGRKMVLTPRAQGMIQQLQGAMDQLEQVIAPPQDFDAATFHHTFNIITSDWSEVLLLPRVLEQLSKQAPHVNLRCHADSALGHKALEDGSADLMLGVVHDPPAGLLRQTIYEDTFVCMVSARHHKNLHTLSAAQYMSASHIGISSAPEGGDWVERQLRAQNLERHVTMVLPHFSAAPLIVAQGTHILTLPSRLAQTFESFGAPVKLLEMPIALNPVRLNLLFHQKSQRDPAHMWFRRLIHDIAKQPARSLCAPSAPMPCHTCTEMDMADSVT